MKLIRQKYFSGYAEVAPLGSTYINAQVTPKPILNKKKNKYDTKYRSI